MKMRMQGVAGLSLIMLAAACGAPSDVEPPAPAGDEPAARAELVGEGEAIAETLCATCHATGTTGESPHADAPPLRQLSALYPVETLAEPLAEGIVVGHPDMPEWQFEPQQIDALLAYLESIQEA